jgi:hypothetical protein
VILGLGGKPHEAPQVHHAGRRRGTDASGGAEAQRREDLARGESLEEACTRCDRLALGRR